MMGAEEWDARYRDAGLLWTAQPNRFVAAELDSLQPGYALDLGCGEGRNAVWLAERGWTVTAVDFSSAAVGKAQALAAARSVEVDWLTEDLMTWQPPRETFDAVVVAYLHLPPEPLAGILDAAAAAVAPGGVLVAVGHDRDNAERGYGGPPNSALLWDARTLARSMTGLTIERAEQVAREVSTDDGPRTAIDTLIRGRRGNHAGGRPRFGR